MNVQRTQDSYLFEGANVCPEPLFEDFNFLKLLGSLMDPFIVIDPLLELLQGWVRLLHAPLVLLEESDLVLCELAREVEEVEHVLLSAFSPEVGVLHVRLLL